GAGYYWLMDLYKGTPGGVQVVSNNGAATLHDYYGSTSQNAISATVEFQSGRWECIEWGVSQSGGTVDLRLWIDGAEVTDARLSGPLASPPAGSLSLGSTGPDGFAFWIDEIALSDSPIGCSR